MSILHTTAIFKLCSKLFQTTIISVNFTKKNIIYKLIYLIYVNKILMNINNSFKFLNKKRYFI